MALVPVGKIQMACSDVPLGGLTYCSTPVREIDGKEKKKKKSK